MGVELRHRCGARARGTGVELRLGAQTQGTGSGHRLGAWNGAQLRDLLWEARSREPGGTYGLIKAGCSMSPKT